MSQTPDPPTSVGQQLRARREDLDLTQGALAKRIGIDASTVSVTERDRTEIQRSRRAAWERALQLASGSISRAYKDGVPLEGAETTADPPYADMTSPKEAAVWAMDLPEPDRIEIIDAVRALAAQQNNDRRPA
jgi:transcriptional regulator with XRE-family HTH domain